MPQGNVIAWLRGEDVAGLPCPLCGSRTPPRQILRLPWPGQPGPATLLRCRACDGGCFRPASAPAYDVAPTGGAGALAFYLQQGAGIWGMAASLAALGRPPGTRLLELGCGFGFGLDFARRALGWEVLGLDPGPFAAEGRRQLGLPIESRVLEPGDTSVHGRFDVVLASEVIEHVPDPLAFLRTARAALREGGTLLLTTPDLDAARPDTPPGLLVPLLSAGYHLTLQSVASLTTLLREAGFATVAVERSGGASLAARADRDPPRPAPAPEPGVYDRYLAAAAAAAPQGCDVWLGFAARAYRGAVNRADLPAAAALWAEFAAGCTRRFGHPPEAAPAAPAGTLEALAEQEPLCLGPVLVHRALHRLLLGEPRPALAPAFDAAAAACRRLRAALQRIGTDDGDAEDLEWVAQAEATLCAAELGEPGIPARLAALGAPPADRGGERLASFQRRAFVALVNAGQLAQAGALSAVVAAAETKLACGAALSPGELDVLYCAAARDLQTADHPADAALAALRRLEDACAAARSAGAPPGPAWTLASPIRAAEILALDLLGRHEDAAALRDGPPPVQA